MQETNLTEITEALMKAIKENGLFTTVKAMFGTNIRMRLPMPESVLEQSIDSIEFTTRVRNGFHRSGVRCVRDINEIIRSKGSVIGLHNLGLKSDNEVKSRLFRLSWDNMNETQRTAFCRQLVIDNMSL